MNERNYTYEILKEECVGDSLGKHNFNLLSLDTTICNLSSLFFNTDGGNLPLWSIFYDLSVNRELYNRNLLLMLDTYRFDRVSFGTSFLSAYWFRQELTVQYEFNKSTLPYSVGGVSAVPNIFINPMPEQQAQFQNILISNAITYLNNKYPLSSFNENTIINVSVPVYQSDGALTKTYTYAPSGGGSVITTSELPSFDQVASTIPLVEFRKITGFFKKEDNNILGTPIVRLIKSNDQWRKVSDVFEGQMPILSAVAPNFLLPIVFSSITGIGTTVFAQNLQITEGPCTLIMWNQLFSCDVYFSGEATAYGRTTSIGESGPKLGSLSLVFVDAAGNESQPYSYRATTSPNTYLRWDNEYITAYQGYDNVKQMVYRWDNPYKNMANIKFKFLKDDQAISYSVCASRKITRTL